MALPARALQLRLAPDLPCDLPRTLPAALAARLGALDQVGAGERLTVERVAPERLRVRLLREGRVRFERMLSTGAAGCGSVVSSLSLLGSLWVKAAAGPGPTVKVRRKPEPNSRALEPAVDAGVPQAVEADAGGPVPLERDGGDVPLDAGNPVDSPGVTAVVVDAGPPVVALTLPQPPAAVPHAPLTFCVAARTALRVGLDAAWTAPEAGAAAEVGGFHGLGLELAGLVSASVSRRQGSGTISASMIAGELRGTLRPGRWRRLWLGAGLREDRTATRSAGYEAPRDYRLWSPGLVLGARVEQPLVAGLALQLQLDGALRFQRDALTVTNAGTVLTVPALTLAPGLALRWRPF